MIIQIRGTSGSGKSTVMRTVMDSFADGVRPVRVDGKKQPLYYEVGNRNMVVLGHYESPCGGGDTIGSAKSIFNLINHFLHYSKPDGPKHVLVEGLLLSEDVKWSSLLPDLRVVFLTTPLERCLAQIASRRALVGNEKPLNPKNTENRVGVIERARIRLIEAGVVCRRASPEQAPRIILDWISEAAR